jgi:hypothetical protein
LLKREARSSPNLIVLMVDSPSPTQDAQLRSVRIRQSVSADGQLVRQRFGLAGSPARQPGAPDTSSLTTIRPRSGEPGLSSGRSPGYQWLFTGFTAAETSIRSWLISAAIQISISSKENKALYIQITPMVQSPKSVRFPKLQNQGRANFVARTEFLALTARASHLFYGCGDSVAIF